MFKQKLLLSSLVFASIVVVAGNSKVFALVGAHSFTNTETGDVYLGGDYLELGMSRLGSFGTTWGLPNPTGFFGTTGHPAITSGGPFPVPENPESIGMVTNPLGFGVAPDLRMDFSIPGTPEDRWVVGYKIDGEPTAGSNRLLNDIIGPGPDVGQSSDISDNIVTNQSTGDTLKAKSVGTFNDKLKTTQRISFKRGDTFFRNQVTLQNVTDAPLDSVRFMRSFDPDNTVYQQGSFTTHNTIPYTQEAGDGKAVVVADTNFTNNNDPVKAINGSDSPVLFYSSDARARVSTFGFINKDPYNPSVYDEALPKGTDQTSDQAITIAFDVGTLAPGASQTFMYYTSLDNRNYTDAVKTIETQDSDNIANTIEDAGPNNGDGNGDGIADSSQDNVITLPNTYAGSGKYQTITSTGDCHTFNTAGINKSTDLGIDKIFNYPLGLTSFNLSCLYDGGSGNIKIYYDKVYDTSQWQVRKFINNSFVALPTAVFGTETVGTSKVTTLSYTIQDGGQFDSDGLVNGTITDPVGPAAVNFVVPNTGFGSL